MSHSSLFDLTRIHLITDFDGTITDRDTLEFLLDRYGSPEWVTIENQVEQDKISVDEAFQQQMALLRVSMEDALAAVRKERNVDKTFGECAESIIHAGGRVSIVSAGFREIIDYMLRDKITDSVAVYANSLEVTDGRWKVIPSPSPKIRGLCTHCKRYWVEQAKAAGDFVVYAGNGYTDRCPAEAAQRVFARDVLWDHRTRMGLDTERLTDFADLWKDLVQISQGGQV